jgi:hypothetical protein
MTRTARTRSVRSAALLLAATASLGALSACGSDDSSEITSKEASCIAEGAVDELTVERLQEYEILDSDLDVDKKLNEVPLSKKDADALAGVFIDCSDVEKIFEDRLVDQLAGDRPRTRARVESCVREAVTAESVQGILAQSFQKTDAAEYADLSKKLETCR